MVFDVKRALRIVLIAAAVVLMCAAGVLMAADGAYADCMEPGSDVSDEEYGCTSEPGYLVTPDMIPDHEGEGGPGLKLNSGGIKYIPLLVVVVGLNNVSYNTSFNWHDAFFSDYEDSIYKYYKEMSHDKLRFYAPGESSKYGLDGNDNTKDKVNDGVIHVKLNRDHYDWGKYKENNGESMERTFRDAVIKASDYIDLPSYDENGNGKLDAEEFAVVLVIAGYDYGVSSRKKSSSLYLRSHRWTFSGAKKSLELKDFSAPKVTKNDKSVTVNNYVSVSENCEKDDGTVVQGRKGSIAHELGHHLGLPDLYDTTSGDAADRPWEQYDVRHVSLMSSGSWGVDNHGNYRPYSLDPWCRIQMGWTKAETITAARSYSLPSQDYSDITKEKKVLRIDMPYSGEYYLLEARYAERWDSQIVKTHYPDNKTKDQLGGIILWHIDENVLKECYNTDNKRYYEINAAGHRPGVMPFYMELVDNGSGGKKHGLIGTGESATVYRNVPFFDQYLMENTFKSIGQEIELPTYAGKPTSSLPKDRELSGIKVEFASNASTIMSVRLIPPDHVHEWQISYPYYAANICSEGGDYVVRRTCVKCLQVHNDWHENPAGHHIEGIHVSAVDPDCEYDGCKEHYQCMFCGRRFSDAALTNEVSMSDLVIPGGHEWDDGVVIEEPTYYSDGIREITCKACGTSYWESIDKLDNSDKMADDGTTCGPGASIKVASAAIKGSSSEKDMPGSIYQNLKLSSPKQGKKSITLHWKNFEDEYGSGPDYYIVYGAKCGKNKYKKIVTVTDTASPKTVTIKKIGGKKLKPKTYYKFIVVAVSGGFDEVMSTSKTIHVATKGSKKKANYTGVIVSKSAVNKAAAMTEGGQLSLKAKAKKKKGTKVAKHVGLRYVSTNPDVAKVTSKGLIKAKSAGYSRIYIYTQNGKAKEIQVQVE